MRAALYSCTTAADLGQTVHDEKLPELRRYASVRDWEVVGEYTDSSPTGAGRRPGFDQLCAAVAAGSVDVVVANSLHDLWWDLTQIGRIAEPWTRAGVRLVCLRNDFDATTELGWQQFLYFATRIEEWCRGRQRERQRIGVLRSQMKNAGAEIAGRPRVVINPMEVKSGYERGLSQTELLARIRRAGGVLSKGTLWRYIRDAKLTGLFDESVREAALAARGGLPRGGRKMPRGRTLSDQEVIDAYAAGESIRVATRRLYASGVSVSRFLFHERLEQLRAAGRIDEDARRAVLAERAERRRQRLSKVAA